jgi:hypothetical protein
VPEKLVILAKAWWYFSIFGKTACTLPTAKNGDGLTIGLSHAVL